MSVTRIHCPKCGFPLVGTGSWLGRGGGVLITLPLYLVLWSAAEILNDATSYVVFGVSLMLWPCQWAFDLGRSAARQMSTDKQKDASPALGCSRLVRCSDIRRIEGVFHLQLLPQDMALLNPTETELAVIELLNAEIRNLRGGVECETTAPNPPIRHAIGVVCIALVRPLFKMTIKRIPTPDMQRWPVNSTQFLLPTLAVKGFPGNTRHLILAFWRWRVDFVILSNTKITNAPTSGA